jgi:hypothetical protein
MSIEWDIAGLLLEKQMVVFSILTELKKKGRRSWTLPLVVQYMPSAVIS